MPPTAPLLSSSERSAFARDGYVTREALLSPAQVERVKEAFRRAARDCVSNPEDYEHPSLPEGGTLFRKRGSRFTIQLEPGVEPRMDDPEAFELQVRKFMWMEKEDPIFAEILGPDGALARAVGELLEDTPLLYQSMALIKPPRIGSTKPWHQDNAYFSVDPLDAVCGVWIAVDEATPRNGCMHVLRGEHRRGAFRHEHKRDCEISARALDLSTLVPIPLPPGGALFFSGMLPHETPPNRSARRRRALQFHFRREHSTIVSGEAYDRLFQDREGEPASCDAIRRRGF